MIAEMSEVYIWYFGALALASSMAKDRCFLELKGRLRALVG